MLKRIDGAEEGMTDGRIDGTDEGVVRLIDINVLGL